MGRHEEVEAEEVAVELLDIDEDEDDDEPVAGPAAKDEGRPLDRRTLRAEYRNLLAHANGTPCFLVGPRACPHVATQTSGRRWRSQTGC